MRVGCTLPATAATRESLRALLGEPIDWVWLLARGATHHVLPMLQHALTELPTSDVDAVPRDVVRALAFASVEAKAAAQRHMSLLASLLGALRESGVEALVVKGLALAALYPAPELRPAGDIDLLVSEQDWPVVARTFDQLGLPLRPMVVMAPGLSPGQIVHMASYVAQVAYESPCGTPVEVHFRLFNIGVPLRCEDIWERVRSEHIGELVVPTMSREDAVVYHAMHANKHQFSRLIWFVDFRLMLSIGADGLDWDRIVRRADDLRVSRSLAYMVELTQDLFGTIDNVPIASDLAPSGRRAWGCFRRRWRKEAIFDFDIDDSAGLGQWYYLREVASWRNRAAYLIRRTWPPRWCLGPESRWSYLCRRMADSSPRLARLFGLKPTDKAFRREV